MKNGDDQLIRDMARRNWFILCLMVLVSTLWRTPPVTVGVLGGGLVVIAGFHALHRSLKRLLLMPGQKSGLAFQGGTLVRLFCLAGAIFVLVGPLKASPLALIAGLSVVVANLLWTTVSRSLSW
jgi:hypothetical protein